MRIGVDFDGVVTDVAALMVTYAAERLGAELRPEQIVPPAGPAAIGAKLYQRLLDETHATPVSLLVELLPTAMETLLRLGDEHELVVVTARYGDAMGFAERWLEERGLSGAIGTVVSSHGGTNAAAVASLGLGMLIDDVPTNFEGLGAGTEPVLMSAAQNVSHIVAPPMEQVEHWREVEALVAKMKE